VAFFSIVRRLNRLAALSVNAADEAGFLAVIRELPVLKENEAFTARPHGSCFCFGSGRGIVRCSAVSRQIYDVRVTGPLDESGRKAGDSSPIDRIVTID
jgi:hypothetical protein